MKQSGLRLIAVSLCAIMLTIVFASCAAAEEKPMLLKFWSWNGDKVVSDGYVIQKVEEAMNVKLEILSRTRDTYKEKLRLSFASNDPPDFFSDITYAEFDIFLDQGVIAEIPIEMVYEAAPDYVKWLEKWLGDDPFASLMRDGKLYGLPSLWTPAFGARIIGIRTDWMQNVGVTVVPETLEEFEDLLRKFRNDDPDGNGVKDTYGITTSGSMPTALDSMKMMFSFVFGAYDVWPVIFTEKDGAIVRGEIEPAAKDALTVLNRWYMDELIDPEFLVNKNNNLDDKFISGKVGAIQQSWFRFLPEQAFFDGRYYTNIRAAEPDADFVLIGGLSGPGGEGGVIQENALASNAGLFFSKHMEKEPEKMRKYLEVANYTGFDFDILEIIHMGEEGLNYTKDAEGNYEWIPPYDQEEERYKFGISKAVYDLPGIFNDYDLLSKFMTRVEYEPLKDATELIGRGKYDILDTITKPVYNEYYDLLNQYTLQNYLQFITGERPISEFEQFVDEWMKMGGDKVMAEAQEIYDSLK